MTNQFGIDYSFPGLCSLCHAEIADFDGSWATGRPKITKLKGTYREATIELSDKSLMRVPLCHDCYENFKPEDCGKLMESEVNGWHHETYELMSGSDELKNKRMERKHKLSILNRADKPWSLEAIKKISKPDTNNFKKRK